MKSLSFALLLIFVAGPAWAKVTFHTDLHCAGHQFECAWYPAQCVPDEETDTKEITDLKRVRFEVAKYRDATEEEKRAAEHTCAPEIFDRIACGTKTRNFNDRIRSIWISGDEEVRVFKDADFQGDDFWLQAQIPQVPQNDELGTCFNLTGTGLEKKISSIIIHNPEN